ARDQRDAGVRGPRDHLREGRRIEDVEEDLERSAAGMAQGEKRVIARLARDAPVTDLARGLEALEGLDEPAVLEDGPGRAGPLMEIDVIRAEPLQASLGGLDHVAWRKILGSPSPYSEWHALATDAHAPQEV